MGGLRPTRRRLAGWAWALSLICLVTLPPRVAGQEPTRLDGLAAVIGGDGPGPGVDVVLRSDVELRARIALSGGTTGPLPLGPLPAGLLQATLDELIGEHLIAREAQRVQAVSPSHAEVVREERRLMRAAGGSERMLALLDALSARREEVRETARRRALVAAFLSANLEGATVVTDSEVERAYQATRARHAGEDPQELRRRLRARLAREALAGTIERWVRVLRARVPVRVHARY
ncbi:MAG: hypothetical protein PVI30_14905 [Myxococcales bacterium]